MGTDSAPSGWSQLLSWFVDHLLEDSWHQRLEGGRGQDSSCPRGSSLLQVRDAAAVGTVVLISFPSQLKRVFLFSSSILFKRRNHSGNKWHSDSAEVSVEIAPVLVNPEYHPVGFVSKDPLLCWAVHSGVALWMGCLSPHGPSQNMPLLPLARF